MSRFAKVMGMDEMLCRPPQVSLAVKLTRLAQKGTLQERFGALREISARKLVVNAELYENLLLTAMKEGQFNRAWKQAMDAGIVPSQQSFSKIFKVLVSSRRRDELLAVRQSVCSRHLKIGPTALSYYAKVLNPESNMKELEKVCDELLAYGEEHAAKHVFVFSKLMAAYARTGDVESVEQMISELTERKVLLKADVNVYCALISARGRRHDRVGVLQAIEQLDQLKTECNITSYNICMDALLRCGEAKRAVKIFETLRSLKQRKGLSGGELAPNAVTYNIAIDAHTRVGDIRGAESLLSSMMVDGIKPRTNELNVLISGYSKAKLPQLAEAAMDRFKSIPPDRITFSTLIKGYVRCGDISGAERLLQKLLNSKLDIRKSADSFNVLIDCYGKMREVQRMDELRAQMKENRVVPNRYTFNSLADGYMKNGLTARAWKVIAEMDKFDMKPDVVYYSTMINALGKQGDILGAVDTFRRMLAAEIVPDLPAYNALLSALVRNNDIKGAEKVVESMHKKGIVGSAITYTTLIDAHAKQSNLKGALALLGQMQELGVKPTQATYNTLLSAYHSAGDLLGVRATFVDMCKAGFEPDEITMNVTMNALAWGNDLNGLVKVYEAMMRRGLCDPVMTGDSLFSLAHNPQLHRETTAAFLPSFRRKGAAEHAKNSILPKNIQLPSSEAEVPALERVSSVEKLSDGYSLIISEPSPGQSSAEKAFVDMERSGKDPTTAAYATLIQSYARTGDLTSAKASFKQMEADGIRPTLGTVNALLYVCARYLDSDTAAAAMNKLRTYRISPNHFSYNVMMYIYAKQGDNQSVEAIRRALKQNIAPDLHNVA